MKAFPEASNRHPSLPISGKENNHHVQLGLMAKRPINARRSNTLTTITFRFSTYGFTRLLNAGAGQHTAEPISVLNVHLQLSTVGLLLLLLRHARFVPVQSLGGLASLQ